MDSHEFFVWVGSFMMMEWSHFELDPHQILYTKIIPNVFETLPMELCVVGVLSRYQC